jgi:hemerythrin
MLRIHEQEAILEPSSINKAHSEEMELVTKLHTAAKNSESKLVLELLNKLIDHTAKHFSDEEKLMEEADYVGYELHKFEHAKQLLDLQSILSFYEMTNDTQSVYTYLEDSLTPWVIKHVQEMDVNAADFLKNQ